MSFVFWRIEGCLAENLSDRRETAGNGSQMFTAHIGLVLCSRHLRCRFATSEPAAVQERGLRQPSHSRDLDSKGMNSFKLVLWPQLACCYIHASYTCDWSS